MSGVRPIVLLYCAGILALLARDCACDEREENPGKHFVCLFVTIMLITASNVAVFEVRVKFFTYRPKGCYDLLYCHLLPVPLCA